MVTAVPFSDDSNTARDRAEYLRQRNEAPVMSIAAELKFREAMDTGNPQAADDVRNAARARFDLENKVIAGMPTDEFKAFHKEAMNGRHTAGKLLDAAVDRYKQAQAPRDEARGFWEERRAENAKNEALGRALGPSLGAQVSKDEEYGFVLETDMKRFPHSLIASPTEAGAYAALGDAARAVGNDPAHYMRAHMPVATIRAIEEGLATEQRSTKQMEVRPDAMLAAEASAGKRDSVNVIEPVIAPERSAASIAKEPNTEALRAALLERHGTDAANNDKAATDRSSRERISVEREVIGRMSHDQLTDYQSARAQGPTAAKSALDSAMQRLQADVDGRNGVRAVPPLEERFNVIRHIVTKDYEFRDQPGKLAFTERPFSMRSSVDNPAAVKAMVDRALERGWDTIRVSGSSEFQRQAWIAATARGIKAVGYEPTPGDRQTASRERERLTAERSGAGARTANTPSQQARPAATAARERQVMTALDKAMKDGKVPAVLREKLQARVAAESAQRAEQGQRVAVKVYDPAAPRPTPKVPDFAIQRTGQRERAR